MRAPKMTFVGVGMVLVSMLVSSCRPLLDPVVGLFNDDDDPRPSTAPVLPRDGAGIYVASSGGAGSRFLGRGSRPAWSPDGLRIAFYRDGWIHVMNSDGTDDATLVPGIEPAWSPSGEFMAFADVDGIRVLAVDVGGAQSRLLVRDDFAGEPVFDIAIGKPAWSPDGERIAFEHRGDGELMPATIYVIDADGTNLRRLAGDSPAWYAESDPVWSPDGTRIAFWSYGFGLATIRLDNGAVATIYEDFPFVAYGARPSWSPDGLRLLFTGDRQRSSASIYSVTDSEGAVRPVPQLVIRDGIDPAYSPDGTRIAYERRAR